MSDEQKAMSGEVYKLGWILKASTNLGEVVF